LNGAKTNDDVADVLDVDDEGEQIIIKKNIV